MKYIGIDIGYSDVKTVSLNGEHSFPSLVGTPEKSQFSVMGTQKSTFRFGGKSYNVGDTAIIHSAIASRKETRDWLNSEQYTILLHAALYFSLKRAIPDAFVVTGLPVSFYESDKEKMREKFEHTHLVHHEGSEPFTVKIEKCVVIPQVMGTLFNVALDDDGNIADYELASDRVGIIDIGGKTTNMLHAYKLGDVRNETMALDRGGWDIMRIVRPKIEELTPDVLWADHEIAQAIKTKSISHKGEMLDLADIVDPVVEDMAEQIADKANELWSGGARLNHILLSGGGALMMGERVKEMFDHANVRVVENSVFANAVGYYKAALYYGKRSKR